jgi:hypothetical protein
MKMLLKHVVHKLPIYIKVTTPRTHHTKEGQQKNHKDAADIQLLCYFKGKLTNALVSVQLNNPWSRHVEI